MKPVIRFRWILPFENVAGPNTFWRNCHSSNCLVARLHQDLPCQDLDSPTDGHCFSTPPPWNWGVDPYIGKDGTFPGDFSETLDPDMALAQVGKPNSWMVYNGKFIYKPSSYWESPSYTIFHYSYPIGVPPILGKRQMEVRPLIQAQKLYEGFPDRAQLLPTTSEEAARTTSLWLWQLLLEPVQFKSLSNGHHCDSRDILTWKEYSRWQLGRAFVCNCGGFEWSPALLRFLDTVQKPPHLRWEHVRTSLKSIPSIPIA